MYEKCIILRQKFENICTLHTHDLFEEIMYLDKLVLNLPILKTIGLVFRSVFLKFETHKIRSIFEITQIIKEIC